MKRYKMIVPLALVAVLFLSYYMLYSTRTEVIRQYDYYLEEARKYAEQGVAVDAVQNYAQALAINDSIEINLEVGEFYRQIGDATSAIGWGEQMVAKYPETPEAYAFLLEGYKSNSDYNRCYALYETITKRELVTKEIATIMKDIEYVYYFEGGFEDVGVYSNGYCAVQNEGKWGMVNETGQRVVSYQYESVGPFMSDVAPVKTSEGEAYYIDAQGNKKLVVQGVDNIVELSPLLNNVLAVYDGEFWTYYNSDYKKLSEGYDSASVTGNMVAAVEKDGYFHLIDTENKKINDQQYMDVIRDDKGIVYRNDILFANVDGAYYMIDKEGKKISTEAYMNARLFNDQTYAAVEGEKGWYFVDNTGKSIFKDQYFQDARSFANGYAAVKQDGRWGFIDSKGNIVIECIFEDAKDFNASGGVFVQMEDVWQLLKLYSKNYVK